MCVCVCSTLSSFIWKCFIEVLLVDVCVRMHVCSTLSGFIWKCFIEVLLVDVCVCVCVPARAFVRM